MKSKKLLGLFGSFFILALSFSALENPTNFYIQLKNQKNHKENVNTLATTSPASTYNNQQTYKNPIVSKVIDLSTEQIYFDTSIENFNSIIYKHGTDMPFYNNSVTYLSLETDMKDSIVSQHHLENYTDVYDIIFYDQNYRVVDENSYIDTSLIRFRLLGGENLTVINQTPIYDFQIPYFNMYITTENQGFHNKKDYNLSYLGENQYKLSTNYQMKVILSSNNIVSYEVNGTTYPVVSPQPKTINTSPYKTQALDTTFINNEGGIFNIYYEQEHTYNNDDVLISNNLGETYGSNKYALNEYGNYVVDGFYTTTSFSMEANENIKDILKVGYYDGTTYTTLASSDEQILNNEYINDGIYAFVFIDSYNVKSYYMVNKNFDITYTPWFQTNNYDNLKYESDLNETQLENANAQQVWKLNSYYNLNEGGIIDPSVPLIPDGITGLQILGLIFVVFILLGFVAFILEEYLNGSKYKK